MKTEWQFRNANSLLSRAFTTMGQSTLQSENRYVLRPSPVFIYLSSLHVTGSQCKLAYQWIDKPSMWFWTCQSLGNNILWEIKLLHSHLSDCLKAKKYFWKRCHILFFVSVLALAQYVKLRCWALKMWVKMWVKGRGGVGDDGGGEISRGKDLYIYMGSQYTNIFFFLFFLKYYIS